MKESISWHTVPVQLLNDIERALFKAQQIVRARDTFIAGNDVTGSSLDSQIGEVIQNLHDLRLASRPPTDSALWELS